MFGFRKSLNQLITRLQKTKLPGGAEAEFGSGDALKQTTEKKYLSEGKELISDLSARLPNVPDKFEGGQNQENIEPDIEKRDWFFFFTQANYKKARELLLIEIEKEQDMEKVQILKSAAANMLCYYNFSNGVEEYEKLIEEYPTNYVIYSSYSWAYVSSNLPDNAISVLDRGISKIKDSEYLVLRKAQILEQCKRYDEALALANEEVELSGKNKSKYYCLIARIHKATNQENEARAAYIKGFKNDPSDLEVIHEIANYFFELNDYHMEFFFRKHAIILNDKDANDWSSLGNCYLNLGLNNLAIRAYEEANKLAEGKQAWILANIGNLLNNVGLHSKAIEELSKSLEIDSSSQYAHERLSRAISNKDKEDQKAKESLEASRKMIEAQIKPE
jgi:tetratricopeptide (TPR) repeat protein